MGITTHVFAKAVAMTVVSYAFESPRPACLWMDPYSNIPWLPEPTYWSEDQFECAMQDLEVPVDVAQRRLAAGMKIPNPVAPTIEAKHSEVAGYGVFARVRIKRNNVLHRSEVHLISRNCSLTAEGQIATSVAGMDTVHVTTKTHAVLADASPDRTYYLPLTSFEARSDLGDCSTASPFMVYPVGGDILFNHAPSCDHDEDEHKDEHEEEEALSDRVDSEGSGPAAASSSSARCANMDAGAEFLLCWDHEDERNASMARGWGEQLLRAMASKSMMPGTVAEALTMADTGTAALALPPMSDRCLRAWGGARWRALAARSRYEALRDVGEGEELFCDYDLLMSSDQPDDAAMPWE